VNRIPNQNGNIPTPITLFPKTSSTSTDRRCQKIYSKSLKEPMLSSLKDPEMRQSRSKLNFVNCRPSGPSGFQRGNNPTRKKKFFTIKTISDITPNGAIKRWIVISSGKRSVLIRYFFLKFLYDELTRKEYQIFLSFPEVTNIIPIFFALRARIIKIDKITIRKILEFVDFSNFSKISREEYQGLKQIQYSFEEKLYPPIKKPKPYSGYSKGYKDGIKRKTKFQVDEFSSSPLEPGPYFEDEINLLLKFALMIKSQPRNQILNININLRKESNGIR
jgi:hypothetical protein